MIKFIADIGANHNCSIERVVDLIQTAKDVGCWGVKFQLFRPDDLYRGLTDEKRAELEEAALPWDFVPAIAKKCKELGIKFGCTPFSIEAVEYLKDYVDYLKISSYEILRLDLIEACGKTGLPVHISTGMANACEYADAHGTLCARWNKECYMYICRADYPALAGDCNLTMLRYSEGYSDHTKEPGVIYKAAHILTDGFIEFHLDLWDMQGQETKHGHVWCPDAIKEVIHNVRVGESAMGCEHPVTEEQRMQRADPIDGKRPIINRNEVYI
jgi:N-acetylneuraminate synthase